ECRPVKRMAVLRPPHDGYRGLLKSAGAREWGASVQNRLQKAVKAEHELHGSLRIHFPLTYHSGWHSGQQKRPTHADQTFARAHPALSHLAGRQDRNIRTQIHLCDLASLENTVASAGFGSQFEIRVQRVARIENAVRGQMEQAVPGCFGLPRLLIRLSASSPVN